MRDKTISVQHRKCEQYLFYKKTNKNI